MANSITFACSYKTINAYSDFLTKQPDSFKKKVQAATNGPKGSIESVTITSPPHLNKADSASSSLPSDTTKM